jgi:hypothetical protein
MPTLKSVASGSGPLSRWMTIAAEKRKIETRHAVTLRRAS